MAPTAPWEGQGLRGPNTRLNSYVWDVPRMETSRTDGSSTKLSSCSTDTRIFTEPGSLELACLAATNPSVHRSGWGWGGEDLVRAIGSLKA